MEMNGWRYGDHTRASLLDYVLQHKRFYGTTSNVIDVQIWTAFCIIVCSSTETGRGGEHESCVNMFKDSRGTVLSKTNHADVA
jgi:hypothetical protein